MAYNLTERTKNALSRELVEPNLVLEIEGAPKKYAIRIAKHIAHYDSQGLTYDFPELYYDGLSADPDQIDLIAITGTTNSISAQLEPDKGAASSTQTLTVKLIDRNEEITRLISPGVVIPDIMYRNCKLYFGLYETAFPDDYIVIFSGKVMGINPGAGTIDLVITHPDDLKRSSIFEKVEKVLTATAHFDSAKIQDIFYQKRADVAGDVTITYTTAAIGDNANVTVTGNDISIQIDFSLTKAKTIKKKVENDENANQLVTCKIDGNANNIQTAQVITTLSRTTELELDSVNGFFEETASPLFKTYVRINDEIIQYTGIDSVNNKLTGCTRQALDSFGATHEEGDNVQSFYKLGDATFDNGNAIDLSLYLLLSGADSVYHQGDVSNVAFIPGLGVVSNSIYFPDQYLKRDQNVQVGDTCSMTGSAFNDFVGKTILEVVETNSGTYLVIDGVSLTQELDIDATVDFNSQFNVLPDGAGLLPNQVDIDRFRYIKSTYSTAITRNRLYFKDTVSVKECINQRLLFPSALYSIPRKGTISVGITAPPLYDGNTKKLNLDTVKDPKGNKLERSVTKNFYNAVVYRYNEDSVEDRNLNKLVTLSADSINRIDAPARTFLIDAGSLVPDNDTTVLLTRNSNRFLDRYKYGAEFIKLKVLFKTGFPIEVGDAVLFGDPDFYLSDITNGTKDFSTRIMEVTNKEWNWKTGEISLSLLDTTYSTDVRVGVWSPSTPIGTGSTSSQLVMTKHFDTGPLEKEKDKWENYIGREIEVHSADWSVRATTYIQGFDPANDSIMLVSPALPFAPTAGYFIDIVSYEEVDPVESFYKNVHCFWDYAVPVASGASSTSFDVSPSDISKFFVGSLIRVHNADFSIDSGEAKKKVTSITGNTITCDDLGFTPDNTMTVELIGFASDKGKPYTWL